MKRLRSIAAAVVVSILLSIPTTTNAPQLPTVLADGYTSGTPKVQYSQLEYNVAERDLEIEIKVTLDNASLTNTITVKYTTTDGTATALDDYDATSGTLTFAPGEVEKTFKIKVYKDLKVEEGETVILSLDDVVNAEYGTNQFATLTIDDTPPVLTVSPESAAICAGGKDSDPHKTKVTATLTDGTDPFVGETITLTTDRGTLDASSGTTDGNGQVVVTLKSNGTASGTDAYKATVTASAGDFQNTCEVEFQAPEVALSTNYSSLITGETADLEVTITWNSQPIESHNLGWKISRIWDVEGNLIFAAPGTPPPGYGSILGPSSSTDSNGKGTAVYESAENDGSVELEVADQTVTFFTQGGNPKDVKQVDDKKPTLTIKRKKDGEQDYKIVDYSNYNVLPGELMDLRFEADPPPRWLNGYKWEVWDGKAFYQYTASTTSGSLTTRPLVDGWFPLSSISFYWAETGPVFTVTCKAKINNVPVQTYTFFNVKKPIVTHDVKVGMVRMSNDQSDFRFGKLDGVTQSKVGGMDFDGKVEVPDGYGFSQGTWKFLQISKHELFGWKADGTKWKFKNNSPDKWMGDKTPTYPATAGLSEVQTPNEIKTADTPNLKTAPWTKIQRSGSYEMYIMFKPAGASSAWVPLKKVAWGFAGTATLNPATMSWGLTGVTNPPLAPQTAWVDTSDHPTWEGEFGAGLTPGNEWELVP